MSFDISPFVAYQTIEQTTELSVIWDDWLLMWHHCNTPGERGQRELIVNFVPAAAS